jgi:dienelactone hydrolase
MSRLLLCLVVASLLLVPACAEDLKIVSTPKGQVEALFVPLGDTVIVPKPNDIARKDGRVQKPPADEVKHPVQASYDHYLNTLDGWPTGVVFSDVKFSGKLDPESINDQNVMVYEINDLANPVKVELPKLQYVQKEFSDGALSQIQNWAPVGGWKKGMRYVGFVLTGENGVKDEEGNPIIRTAFFDMATGPNPLCAWDESKTWDAEAGACAAPAAGEEAKGCCTFNYSALLESAVKKLVRTANQGKPLEEVEELVHQSILSAATTFEGIRREYDELLGLGDKLGFSRDDVAVLWPFTMLTLTEVVFDPTAVPPIIPTPTDLVRDPATGMLNVSTYPTSTEADIEFTRFLNSLDGWPADMTVDLPISGELDEESLEKAMLLYEIGGTEKAPTLTKLEDFTVTYSATAGELTLTPTGGFKRGAQYAALVLGGENGLKNKDTSFATTPRRQSLMHLVLITDPPCNYDDTLNRCTQIRIDGPCHDDYAGKIGGMDGITKCTIIEQVRRKFDGLLRKIVPMEGIAREDILAMQTFTITSQTEMLMDPIGAGILPLPNDMLLDPDTGLVNMPENPLIPENMRVMLNTLDGFTTVGPAFTQVGGKIDPATISPETLASSMLAVDVTATLGGTSTMADFEFTWDEKLGAIIARPRAPLKENNQYAIVFFSQLEDGEMNPKGGVTDDQGRRVIPSKFFALLRSKAPLFDFETGKSLISVLDDTYAEGMEGARQMFEPLFDKAHDLLGFGREDMVTAWVYTTQSITKPTLDIREKALAELQKRDNGQPMFSGTLDTTFDSYPEQIWDMPITPDNHSAWVDTGYFKTWFALDEMGTRMMMPDISQGELRDVPFTLILPKGPMPAAGWPLIIYQHGWHSKRKAVAYYASEVFSEAGFAMIAFDMLYGGDDRTWCVEDAHCADNGTCDAQTGTCSTDLKRNPDGEPQASGERLLTFDNVFGIPDNLRQHMIDGSAFFRAIEKGAFAGLTGGTVKIDTSNVFYLGRCLGGTSSFPALTNTNLLKRVVSTTGAGRMPEIFMGGSYWESRVKHALEGFGVERGTFPLLQLMQIFQWIVDPSEPANWAKYMKEEPFEGITPKPVMLQVSEWDAMIPPHLSRFLAEVLGVAEDMQHSTMWGVEHGHLAVPDPIESVTYIARQQIVHFFKTGEVCVPNYTIGTCP